MERYDDRNRGKNILFIAASLDGYTATKDDSLDWLFKEMDRSIELELAETKRRNQFLELIYRKGRRPTIDRA